MSAHGVWQFLVTMMGSSLLERIAAVLALLYLLLAVRRNLWCWLCALVSSVLYLIVMLQARLLMQTLLQVFYVVMAGYGFWQWRAGRDEQGEVAPRRWPLQRHLQVAAAVLVLSVANGALTAHWQAAQAPYLDAFVAWGSVITTWMVTQRLIENWLYWVVVDLAGAWLYFSQGLMPTGILFLIYVGIVIHGYFVWRRSLQIPSS
ncbi:MAG: nicotinamide riboside transporter PnuC [Steroidobacteraceae bacterium]